MQIKTNHREELDKVPLDASGSPGTRNEEDEEGSDIHKLAKVKLSVQLGHLSQSFSTANANRIPGKNLNSSGSSQLTDLPRMSCNHFNYP
jgi:hypothetical protein